jgi:hypothetical protein
MRFVALRLEKLSRAPLIFPLKLASATKRIPQEVFVVFFDLNEKVANL